MSPAERTMFVLSEVFLDSLIKRSTDAEDIMRDCGRIRLQKAALAAVELYLGCDEKIKEALS